MAAPTSKTELLQTMDAARQEWDALLDQLSDAEFKQPGVVGIWSVKEVVAHICAYEQYMAAMMLDQGSQGANVTGQLDAYYQTNLSLYRAEHPELPEHVQQLRGDQVNEVFVAAYRYKPPKEVRKMEREAYGNLRAAVEAWSNEELAKPFTEQGYTLLQILPGQCYTHWRQHIPAIQQLIEKKRK